MIEHKNTTITHQNYSGVMVAIARLEPATSCM